MDTPYITLANTKEADRVLELRIGSDGVGGWYDTVGGSFVRAATEAELSRAKNRFWGLPYE